MGKGRNCGNEERESVPMAGGKEARKDLRLWLLSEKGLVSDVGGGGFSTNTSR